MRVTSNGVRAGSRARTAARAGALLAASVATAALVATSGAPGTGVAGAMTMSTSTDLPPAPVAVKALAYSGGRAYVSWTAGQGSESDSYHVETYLQSGGGYKDEGGMSAVGYDTVIGGLTARSTYVFAVSAVNAAGTGPATNTPAMTAVGLLAPGAPTGVKLTSDGTDNQLTLTWTPSSASPAAEKYAVGVFEGSGSSLHQVGAVSCDAPCNTETIQATPGSVTSIDMVAQNGVGSSPVAWSNQVNVTPSCALACVTVAAGSPAGAFNGTSDGFLSTSGAADAQGLAPVQWRTNDMVLTTMSSAQVNDMKTAAVTELLSDDWLQSHNVGGYAVTPWSDWATYSTWVQAEVTSVEALATLKGVHISYWDVQNEPFGGGYYSSSSQPPASETVSTFETQFLTAYRAIKAADPSAQVIGPSLIAFAANPADVSGGIDMRTFLDFCVANGIQLGAVSFHDNNFKGSSGWYEPDSAPAAQPAEVQGHVSELKQLLAERPSLGNPAVLVNEYGDPYTYELPGWDVGRIAALDGSGVTGANRSCWGNCGASLDGLLTSDGASTLPGYWVYSFYSSMAGQTVPVTSTYTDITGIASINSTGTVEALVGRHQSCLQLSSPYCPSYPSGQATISVQVPGATNAQVTMAVIPMGSSLTAPLPALTTTTTTVAVVNGVVTVSPSLNDGDAVEITVTPTA